MRQALLSQRGQQSAGQLALRPTVAPVRGWNTRDPVSSLNPLYAQILDNLYPTEGAVGLRGGHADWATGVTNGCKTIFSFQPNNTTNAKLFAVGDSGVYDITAGGAVGAAVQALTNGLFETVNITNSAGTNYVWGVNGTDTAKHYDGTTWATPTITGITSSDANWCWLFKRRIFVVIKNSMKCAYGPIDSIAGNFATMNLGAIFKRGGKLLSGANWTVDGGSGSDDYCVFLTSEGEVAIYAGVNPASASSWNLVGVFFAGRPATRRCFTEYGGDLLIDTELGKVSVARLMTSKLIEPQNTLSDVIRETFAAAQRAYRANSGWQSFMYPPQNALFTNIPVSTTESVQFVMNGVTGAWCSFSAWNALCFGVHNGVLYFGRTDGSVQKAWDGAIAGDDGEDVIGTLFSANYKFNGALQSQIAMVRPIIETNGSLLLRLGIVSDFDPARFTSVIPRTTYTTGGVWGVGLWGTMVWGAPIAIVKGWRHVSCDPGTYLALYLQILSNDATIAALAGNDFQVKSAGWM